MKCGHYFIDYDKTGFPLIRRKDWKFFISLFPISKYQFERFLVEVNVRNKKYTDEWYRNILARNPRLPWRKASLSQTPWRLFLTGVSPLEIQPFLKYLGRDFRLPTLTEWQQLFERSLELRELKEKLIRCFKKESKNLLAPPVILWMQKDLYPLVEEGLLEMIHTQKPLKESVYCLGRAWQGLWSNTYSASEVKEIDFKLKPEAIGFRVVKEIP